MDEHRRAIVYLSLTAILWSLGGLLIKSIPINPLAISGLRSLVSSLFLLGFVNRRKIRFQRFQVAGALAYAATLTLFVVANKLTTAANAILLQYTAPLWVAIFGIWFLKERPESKDWMTLTVVLGGMGLFFLDQLSWRGLWGNILALTSGLAFAWLILLLRKQKAEHPLESIFLGNVLTALLGLPFVFNEIYTFWTIAGIAILGIFQIGLPYLLYSKAIKQVKALEAILIPVLEPILNPVWVFLFLGESPGRWAMLGGTIVLAAIIAGGLRSLKKN